MTDAAEVRRLWHLFEPVHALVYFAPEPRTAYQAAGLKGGWMGYFASRSAALGAVPAPVVTATFYNFHPAMVARSIPDAWGFASPETVLAARLEGVSAALARVLGAAIEGDDVRRSAELALEAVRHCDAAGRSLFGGHVAQPVPEQPHLALWHAVTCLREHRGDGHVACLVAEGLDGCEANVAQAAAGRLTAQMQQDFRGWSAAEWAAATGRLSSRGVLDAAGAMTDAGHRLLDHIEARTDARAAAPYDALGERGRADLAAALAPLARAVVTAGGLPFPNPMALPPPPV